MPELPEVETTCRGVKQAILSSTIMNIVVRESRLRWHISEKLSGLTEIKVLSVERRAKYILIYTSKGNIIIHLGMSGRLTVVDKDSEFKKHDHVDFILSNNKILRYTDPRRFGSIHWTNKNPITHPLLINLGPEPLSKEFNTRYLIQKCQKKKQAIKLFIMNQAVVVGVGNIYANEALFIAKIHPFRAASSLTKAECKTLANAIKTVLSRAIKAGGTTLKDFLSPTSHFGYFVQELLVYGRKNEKCLVCKKLLSSSKKGQRITVFCSYCQF